MSTINPSQAGGRVHPRRNRQLILVGLILLLALAVAAATLHSVNGRDGTMTSPPPASASLSSRSMPAGSS
jgi:hypothetical protein